MRPQNALLALWILAVLGRATLAGADGVMLRQERDALLVPVSLNGVGPYPFILDLAAPAPVVATDVAVYLGLQASAIDEAPLPGGETARAFRAPIGTFTVGEASLPFETLVVTDLSGLERRLGDGVAAGILPGVCPGHTFTLDFPAGVATLSQGGDTDGGIQPDLNDEGPAVRAVVNGRHLRAFTIDTTFAGVIGLPADLLREWAVLTDQTPRLTLLPDPEALERPLGHTQIRLDEVRAGAAAVKAPVCAVLPAGAAPRLGLGFLKHFTMHIAAHADGAVLRIEADGEPPRDPPIVGYGLALSEHRDGYWRVHVAQDSPAARVGVQPGSRIETLNGRPAHDQPASTLVVWLAAPEGQAIELGLRHNGAPRTARLVAEPLL